MGPDGRRSPGERRGNVGAVLIVDDHPPTARAISALLRSAGHRTTCAAGGAEALSHLETADRETGRPDVVVLDVMMPEMDGWTVLRRLRADPRFQSLPVLMYSALDDDRSRATAKEAGANGYLVKGRTEWTQVRAAIEHFLAPAAGRSPDRERDNAPRESADEASAPR